MTGLEKIVKQIQDEARQAADAVTAQAKAEAQQIANAAIAESEARAAAIRARSKTDVENCAAAAKSAAELARRRAVLAAKQQIIGDALAAAQESVYALPDADYFALILRMAGKFSLPQVGKIHFSVSDLKRLPDGFAEALEKASKGGLALSKEPRSIHGGFVLVYGGVEENCSIEALFYAAREELQDKVQRLLFS